jgi:Tfp pilus assembly protein FimV
MLFSTPTQWVVLVLVLVAGWLFGLASHPGGGKWKARYLAERDAHAANRKQADARIAEARTGETQAVADLKSRHAELERENQRLRSAAPVTAATIAPRPDPQVSTVPIRTGERVEIRPGTATGAARSASPAGERRGWFDWGTR